MRSVSYGAARTDCEGQGKFLGREDDDRGKDEEEGHCEEKGTAGKEAEEHRYLVSSRRDVRCHGLPSPPP